MGKADIAKAVFEANPELNAIVVFDCGNAFNAADKTKIDTFKRLSKTNDEGELFERSKEEKPKTKKEK